MMIAVALAGCAAALAWMYRARGEDLVGRANVVGGLAGAVGVVLAVLALWPRGPQLPGLDEVERRLDAALEYLAQQTLSAWQRQAKDRRITTPAPALVSWQWAGPDIATPATDLTGPDRPALLTAGEITRLRQLYEQLPTPARMVILGGPGAGKTTAMLLLLIDILIHRAPPTNTDSGSGAGGFVPVWVTLGGWNPATTPLIDWAAGTLNRDYPGLAGHGGPGAARTLLEAGRIALFLDGLDEMPEPTRGRALHTIDQATTGLAVVLTSRPDEYQHAIGLHRLWNAAVIDLQPVALDDACTFLLHEQIGERYTAWCAVTAHLTAHPESVAARTLRDPLALNLARDTYTHTTADPIGLLDYRSSDALRRHLFTRLLAHAYPDPAEHARALFWLTWIARHLHGTRDIRWWEIPTWTARTTLTRLVVGFLGGLVAGLIGGLMFGLVGGLAIGPPVGLMVGLTTGRGTEPRMIAVRRLTRGGLVVGLVVGLLLALVVGLIVGLVVEPAVGLPIGLVVGLVGGLSAVIEDWSKPLPTVGAASPEDTYSVDLRRLLVAGLVVGVGFMVVFGVGFVLVGGLVVGLAVGLVVVFGGMFGLRVPGAAGALAIAEGLVMARGRRVRFIALLKTAADRQVLRRAGAIYQFRHAALQDHLLATSTPADTDAPVPRT
ncbi:hypothetical protein ACFQS1_38285 [Paractinoplanes rhizophilus]|uniref:NACHT domain-containing protein n=1 Tax=Paractinoplanes rhizophilus TaxID=1416877 RepID=A0ABW2I4M2_9ACTN